MSSHDNCPLCNELLADSNRQADTTTCDHVFHTECIHKWVMVTAGEDGDVSCPVCKQSLNHIEPGLDYMGLDGWRVWGPGGPETEISHNGWRAWGPAEGWASVPDLYFFNVRAPDGRWAIGCYFLYGLWWNPWQTLKSALDLLASIPRVNIQVDDPDGRRVLMPVQGMEEERAMVFDIDDVVGPFLWEEGDCRNYAVQEQVDFAVMFSLVWLDRYQ